MSSSSLLTSFSSFSGVSGASSASASKPANRLADLAGRRRSDDCFLARKPLSFADADALLSRDALVRNLRDSVGSLRIELLEDDFLVNLTDLTDSADRLAAERSGL